MSSFSKWFSKDNLQRLELQKTGQTVFSATDYCERGQKSMDAGNHVEAMEYFQAAIDADSHFEKAYLLLAEVYQKQGKIDKAKSTLYALLALDPDNKKALGKIDELNGNHEVKESPDPQSQTKPTAPSSNTPKTKQKTNAGEISFKVTKWLWFLLCFTVFVLSIVLAVDYDFFDDFFDGGFENGLIAILIVNYFFTFIVYKFLYILLYRRDNWKGEKFGKDKYNPIVYNTTRNIIYSVFLMAGIIALIVFLPLR